MLLTRLLNACHHFPGFVYTGARLRGSINTIDIDVRPRQGSKARCSGCREPGSGYDLMPQRGFEFIPIWGFAVVLLYCMRRVDCTRCGVKVEEVPWGTFQANLLDYGDRINADPVLQGIFRREIADSAVMYRRAFDAGVPLLCGTESGFSVTPYGDWHYRELEVFVREFGLTPLQAIRAGTYEGARALRLEGKVGEIAPGRFADIIGVAGDPSKDVTVLGERKRLKFVMKGGRSVDLETPDPVRKPIPGWRVNTYGNILSRDLKAHQMSLADVHC